MTIETNATSVYQSALHGYRFEYPSRLNEVEVPTSDMEWVGFSDPEDPCEGQLDGLLVGIAEVPEEFTKGQWERRVRGSLSAFERELGPAYAATYPGATMGEVQYTPVDSCPGFEFELSYESEGVDRIHHFNVFFSTTHRYSVEYDIAHKSSPMKRSEFQSSVDSFRIGQSLDDGASEQIDEARNRISATVSEHLHEVTGGKELDRLVTKLSRMHKALRSDGVGYEHDAAAFRNVAGQLRDWQSGRILADAASQRLASLAVKFAEATASYLQKPTTARYRDYDRARRALNRARQ